MLQASTRENIQTWGETQKCIKIGALPTFTLFFFPFVPSSLCTLCHVFSAIMGYLSWLFLFYKKNNYPPHPNDIFWNFKQSNYGSWFVHYIPLSHLNQNVMWNVIFLMNRWIWFIILKQENFRFFVRFSPHDFGGDYEKVFFWSSTLV
jgi:hypothetical protein